MRCVQCGFDNREGVRFCEECGARLELICPACRAAIPPGRKFCGSCGQALARSGPSAGQNFGPSESRILRHLAERILISRSALERARKQVTLLIMAYYTALPPSVVRIVRLGLTYILPTLAVLYVVICGLWLVPDGMMGMYGNHDGHWASWSARAILEWGRFLDFSPFAPLTGTGSIFLPNLPWLNPGALALTIPGALAEKHLFSMLIYLTELLVSLYFLYRHLNLSRAQSLAATLIFVAFFFIPLNGYFRTLPWFSLAPMNANLTAALNFATIALIRLGRTAPFKNAAWAGVFLVLLFATFSTAPVTSITYIPIYLVLWTAIVLSSLNNRDDLIWKCGTVMGAAGVLWLIGLADYLLATALTSVRGQNLPGFLHSGGKLLTFGYWLGLTRLLNTCGEWYNGFLLCPSAPVGRLQIGALVGALALATFGGTTLQRLYAVSVAFLIAGLHVYQLLSIDTVLGRLHVLSTPYLFWALFPLLPGALIGGAATAGKRLFRKFSDEWALAAWNVGFAIALLFLLHKVILPAQPRFPGSGPLGLPPIAHTRPADGPIINFLRENIALRPGGTFRGYAATFLGASDGFVRKANPIPGDARSFVTYITARDALNNEFGNSFQMMDLWNFDIPTFEEYGQWVTKQMFAFQRDMLADPQDQLDTLPASLVVYRFRANILRALGVRYVIADGTIADPMAQLVLQRSGKTARVNLYELKGANVGNFSPTQIIKVTSYREAIRTLQTRDDLEKTSVVMGAIDHGASLVSASASTLIAIKDGYRVSATSAGRAMLVLPVQFSHCWTIQGEGDADVQLVRTNVVQTGVLFKNKIDMTMRFDFEPWKARCRLQDAHDLADFGIQ